MLNQGTRNDLWCIALAVTLATGCTLDEDLNSTSQAETRTILARGSIAGFEFKRTAGDWEVEAKGEAPTDFVMSRIDLSLGECVPWHIHSGPVFVIVKAGTGTNYQPHSDGCHVTTNPAGTGLTDDGLHIHSMCNEGPEDLLSIFVTYLVPKGSPTNIPVPNPGTCPGGAP